MGNRTVRDTLTIWVSMAFALFKPLPPPILGGVVPEDRPEMLKEKVDRLVDDVQELQRELRRRRVI